MVMMKDTDRLNAVYKELEPMGASRCAPMCNYTTFRIGGPADILFTPHDEAELIFAVQCAMREELPYFLMGAGSNMLVSDMGIRGLVIRLCSPRENNIQIEKTGDHFRVVVPSSLMLTRVARMTAEYGMQGLEWAYGIPGTVGGAVAMNAGAYTGEIKNVLRAVRVLEHGEIKEYRVQDEDLGYRRSAYSYPDRLVLSAEFQLLPDDGGAKERMEDFMSRRREKQPLDLPSAGSTFKRPEGHYAGALIEAAGLKGTKVGDACVSTMHAGFIVNMGNATCDNVCELVDLIKKRVYENSGIMLEEELKIVGER